MGDNVGERVGESVGDNVGERVLPKIMTPDEEGKKKSIIFEMLNPTCVTPIDIIHSHK